MTSSAVGEGANRRSRSPSLGRELAQFSNRHGGESANTLCSYRSALRYWAAWFALRYRQPIALPVAEAVLLQSIVDHAQRLDVDGRVVSELPPTIDLALA